jgi:hypothetical protein
VGGGLSVRVGLNIYKTLLRPEMAYWIEVMDRCVCEDAERVRTFFGRAVLGVKKRTAGGGYMILKYWGRLIGYADSILVKKIYR